MENSAMARLAQDAGKRMSREAAERMAARARELAPRDTGELAESIHVEETENGANVIVGTDHWAPIEYGHHEVAWGHETNTFVPAQPFMRPAMDAGRAS